MMSILIHEPHPLVRDLLARMVRRLGHEPVLYRASAPERLAAAELLVVETAALEGAALAQASSLLVPEMPIVCASVAGPPPELVRLGVRIAACVVKPYTLDQLDEAIGLALARARPPTELGPLRSLRQQRAA